MKKVLILLFILCGLLTQAQIQIGRETLYNFTQGSFNYNYLVYYPSDYFTSTKNYPVVFFFYGLGHDPIKANGEKNPPTILFNQGIADQIENNAFSPNFLCVSIQTPIYNGTQPNGWNYGNPTQVDIVLSHIIPTLRIDLSKMVQTGLSAGGQAVMLYNANKTYSPKYRFAAIVPMSAAVDTTLLNLKRIADSNLHVWAFGSDPGDSPFGIITHRIVNNINKLKPSLANFTNIRNGTVGHCCWQDAYNISSGLYDWIAKYSVTDIDTTTQPIDTTHQDTTHHDTTIVNPSAHRKYPTKLGDNGIYLNGNTYQYNSGDTIVLKASQNPYSYVTLDNFHKDSIVIINEGGQVILTNYNGDAIPGGFGFTNSQFIKVTGTGSADKYGFKVTTPNNRGAGVTVTGRSSNIEVSNVEIYDKGIGMYIKQEASCIDSLQFPNWVIHDISIHDNYVHNCQQEGMYIGSTDPNGLRTITCNGVNVNPKPLRMGNIHVYNNIIDSTGRGNIQVSSADSGESEINNNVCTRAGYEWNTQQGNNIVVGSYFHGSIHDNNCSNALCAGIASFGSKVNIYGNNVNNSGHLDTVINNGNPNIFVDTRPSSNGSYGYDSTIFFITDNITGINTDFGIRIGNTLPTYQKGNVLANNTGTFFVPLNIDYVTNIDSIGEPIDSLVIGTTFTIYKADGTTFTPVNWQTIRINKKGNYVVIYADGTKQYFKVKR